MSPYKSNSQLNSDKMFFINLSGLDERFDPVFYKAVERINDNITSKAKYKCEKLIKSCKIKRGRFGHRPRNDPKFYGGKYPFLQTGDIVKATENNSSIKYTQTLNELGLKTSKLFEPPQLLFTIAANIGETAILDYPSCFPDSIVALIPDKTISIEYLNIYLKLIKPYVVDLAPYSAQKNLNNQQLAQVPIVIPPKPIQSNIVQIADEAYTKKQNKETEAKELLESIDTYLLRELGITILDKDESLENRIFYTKISEVANGRFDPKLYDNNTKAIRSAIQNSIFKDKPRLKDLIVHSVAGDWGKDPKDKLTEKQEEEYSKCLVIRATEFDNLYNLKLDNSRVKYRLINNDKLKRIDVQPNDLLIEKSGGSPDQPVGRISIIRKKLINKHNLGYSNFIHKIRVNTSRIDPEYLFCFLKTVHNIKLTDAMQSQTNGIRNLIMSNYFDQIIPLPNIEKQTEIANHINSLRTRAQELEIEAKQVIKIANKEIEKLILEE